MLESHEPRASGTRGQSSIIGMVLVLGFTLAIAGSIVVVGSVLLTDAQQTAQTAQAEQAMSQLDSRASKVAIGEAGVQTVRLGNTDGGQVNVDTDAGRITITAVDDTGPPTTIANETFGAVFYESGRETIAYQGGGIWRRGPAGGSTMVSAPEYHYRGRTLTFPIVRVTGEEWSGSPNVPLTVSGEGSDQLFPAADRNNPLEDGHVIVEVESEFHRGWKSFFETRTEGTVSHDPANQTVSVNLTTPYREGFENAVTATSTDSDPFEERGRGDLGSRERDDELPSASPRVEERIEDCDSGGCTDLTTAGSTLENGTYYHGGDVSLSDTTYNTSEGAVHVVVDGDLEFAGGGGPPGTANHEITGDGQVHFYVNGSVRITGNTRVNTGGDASDLLVMIHSDGGDVSTARGTPQFTGLIYAPNSSLTIRGNAELVGGVVVRDASARGNSQLSHSNPDGFRVEFTPIDTITFLHVSENRVSVGA